VLASGIASIQRLWQRHQCHGASIIENLVQQLCLAAVVDCLHTRFKSLSSNGRCDKTTIIIIIIKTQFVSLTDVKSLSKQGKQFEMPQLDLIGLSLIHYFFVFVS
jgi:hypothetical protein